MLIDRHCDHAYRREVPWNGRALSCLVALALVFGGETLAQDSELRTYGDPAVRTAVDPQVRKIYELGARPGTQIELMTRDNPLNLRDALGTELTESIIGDSNVGGSNIGGSGGRIVGAVWTKQGKYSIEFYRDGDKLLMVYETFTYFAESAPRDAWHNFKGLPAWECRIYFGPQGEVGYAETRGRQAPAPEMNGKKFQQQAQHLVELLSKSLAHWERR